MISARISSLLSNRTLQNMIKNKPEKQFSPLALGMQPGYSLASHIVTDLWSGRLNVRPTYVYRGSIPAAPAQSCKPNKKKD